MNHLIELYLNHPDASNLINGIVAMSILIYQLLICFVGVHPYTAL